MTTLAYPPGRYGRRREATGRRWVVPALATVCAVAVAVVLVLAYRAYVVDAVTGQVLHYRDVTDTQVAITFEVVRPPGTRVECVVRARAQDGSEVGRASVAIPSSPAGGRTVVVTHVLPTTKRPYTGELVGCLQR